MPATSLTRADRVAGVARDRRWPSIRAGSSSAGRFSTPVISTLAAACMAVVFPTVRADQNLEGGNLLFVAVTSFALLVAIATPRSAWWARIVTAASAGAAVYPQEGRTVAIWVPLSILLTAWCPCDRPPLPVRGTCSPGTTPAAFVLSAVALAVGLELGANWQPMLALLCALAFALGATGRTFAPGVAVQRLGQPLESVFELLLSGVVAFAVGVLGIVRRALVRSDGACRAGWLRPAPVAGHPASRRLLRDREVRLRWWVVAVVVVASTVPVAVVARGADHEVSDARRDATPRGSAAYLGVQSPSDPIPAAYEGEEWYPAFRQDMAWVMDERIAWRPLSIHRVLDVETRTVNVRDRRRVTIDPPRCEGCPTAEVWLYGGSGAFGLGQRDAHTIASGLVRAAARDGVRVEVHNRGMPGMQHWRNSVRLAWDLSQEPAPDMVVFYEGAHEVEGELDLRRRGLGNTLAPYEELATRVYDEVSGVEKYPLRPSEGIDHLGWARIDDGERPPGRLAVERFIRSQEMSRASAALPRGRRRPEQRARWASGRCLGRRRQPQREGRTGHLRGHVGRPAPAPTGHRPSLRSLDRSIAIGDGYRADADKRSMLPMNLGGTVDTLYPVIPTGIPRKVDACPS